MHLLFLNFANFRMLEISLPLYAAAIAVAAIRRINITASVALVLAAGLLLLALAAGEPTIALRHTGAVLVTVDLSPSTRTATYRRRDVLMQRIDQLLGNTPRQIVAFAQSTGPLPPDQVLPDIPADQTVFSPPTADAILLFSDGQFDLPTSSAPTFAVIDPALENPRDAAVTQLDFHDDRVIAAIRNTGPPRQLNWSNAIADDSAAITASGFSAARPTSTAAVAASLSPGDPWPENDSLAALPPPPPKLEKWWIGSRNPGPDWRMIPAASIPTDATAYLNAAVIVLDNVDPDSLTTQQQNLLAQYIRDLGGGMLIVGGDHALGRSAIGTPLDAVSPLSASPPTPATRWVFLVDSSGSMTGPPWQNECAAIALLPPMLPPADPTQFGSFAQSLRWWPTATPPADLFPRGPTNLVSALNQVIDAADASLPTQLLIVTDAQADLPSPADLAARMNARRIHLNVLAIGDGSALPALRSISAATGGSSIQQPDISQWITAARQLVHDALPDHRMNQPIEFRFTNDLASLGSRRINRWNRTWLRSGAIELARSSTAPMAALWQVGSGRVAAMAYLADVSDAFAVAARVAQPPRDPRFNVTVTTGARIHISVQVADAKIPLDDNSFSLDLSDATGTAISAQQIPRTAVDLFELEIPALRRPAIAAVRRGSQVLDRFAIAGRYPAEFDAIGNNRPNLQLLADRSGGKVIEPSSNGPIDFSWSPRRVSLTPALCAMGAALLAIGMIRRQR